MDADANRSVSLPLLRNVRIASACPARWEDMTGNDTVRHCALCNLNVHNLAAMSAEDAERLLSGHFGPDGSANPGRLCAVIYRRADGTVLTRDCPVGWARVRAAARRSLLRAAAALALVTGLSALAAMAHRADASGRRVRWLEPFASVARLLSPPVQVPLAGSIAIRGEVTMGKVAPLPTPPSQPDPDHDR